MEADLLSFIWKCFSYQEEERYSIPSLKETPYIQSLLDNSYVYDIKTITAEIERILKPSTLKQSVW